MIHSFLKLMSGRAQNYHLANGGVSRYYKFDYLLNSILPKFTHLKPPNIDDLLQLYSHNVKSKLLECEIASQLKDLRFATRASTWSIVSGSDQTELREVFEYRNLTSLFDGGIWGSPDNKFQILAREKNSKSILKPSLFLGDSVYDSQLKVAWILYLYLIGQT